MKISLTQHYLQLKLDKKNVHEMLNAKTTSQL